MEIMNRKNIRPIEDACGTLQELYTSDNSSLSYSTITNNSKPHKHQKLEEVYFIVKGKATLKVGTEFFTIKAGDVFSIPKNKYHNISDVEEAIELIVVTHPRFNHDDLFY